MKLREGLYITEMASQGMYALGIDNEGGVWEWGGHRITSNSETCKWFEPSPDCMERNSTPY